MSDLVSPLTLEMLVHFHACAEPFGRLDAPACAEMAEWMIGQDLIEPHDYGHGATYRTTGRGTAWLRMMQATPLPQSGWHDPRDGQIVDVSP